MEDIYRRFVRDRRDHATFADLSYRSKKQILHETMSGDINSLGHQLNRFSERNRHFRDFTLYSLISTIKEIIACFPVYRTYVTPGEAVAEDDRGYITEAVRCARRRATGVSPMVFNFVAELLLKQTKLRSSEECEELARFIGKFQQITSPVAAKGIEDTALYVYNRLLSLNEVGSDPTVFGLEPSAVHEWMTERQRAWPTALSATSTHDSKRGEDVRARLNVLSEIPGAWKAAIAKWRAVNRKFKTEINGRPAPDANEEYLVYQTLVGSWPFTLAPEDEAAFRDRISGFIVKALREAKVNSSWLNPDEEYESAVTRFAAAIMDRRRGAPFRDAFLPFHARVADLGIYNSLAQLAIKITAPGIPDFYRGTEFWDLNLVDPDNRRPVDFAERQRVLATLHDCGGRVAVDVDELLASRRDGRIKLFATAKGLAVRARFRDVFERGEYVPLQTFGLRKDCAFAFERRLGETSVVTCVPRLIVSLVPDAAAPPIGAVWGDTEVELSSGAPLRNIFTDATITPDPAGDRWTVPAAALFDRLPIAVLASCAPAQA
jgi:(1->4)-alpha-D-glucan 1-alpha-D-glucosylmutase